MPNAHKLHCAALCSMQATMCTRVKKFMSMQATINCLDFLKEFSCYNLSHDFLLMTNMFDLNKCVCVLGEVF